MYYVDAWHGGPVEEGGEKRPWVVKDFCSFKIPSLKSVILHLLSMCSLIYRIKLVFVSSVSMLMPLYPVIQHLSLSSDSRVL